MYIKSSGSKLNAFCFHNFDDPKMTLKIVHTVHFLYHNHHWDAIYLSMLSSTHPAIPRVQTHAQRLVEVVVDIKTPVTVVELVAEAAKSL